MGRVDGKVALVSGGARGLGASHARMLVAEGARVVVGDIIDGEQIAADLGEDGRFVHLDVTQPQSWDAAVQVAVETFGGLDVLVNNAGIATFAPIEDFTHEQWDAIVAVNLTGVFNGVKAAMAALKRSGQASIVNVSSSAGMTGYEGIPGYVATKWGVRGFTKAVALELGPHGVRCNSIHPGVIRSPMTEMIPDSQFDRVALHRIGEPEEVSRLVVFLASDDSSYATGAEFVLDGGETAGWASPPG